MSERGPAARCLVKGCPVLGYFAHHDGLCPIHRLPQFDKPPGRPPTLAEQWEVERDDDAPPPTSREW